MRSRNSSFCSITGKCHKSPGLSTLAFGIVLLSHSQSRIELFSNTQDFQVPVCPLCNKPVPVPRGEQPDIKVCIACGNITSKMLKLKEFGIYWSIQCVIFSLVSLHHSFIFLFFYFFWFKKNVTLCCLLWLFRLENTLIEIVSLILQLQRERHVLKKKYIAHSLIK